jgi:hypothetical protein
MWRDPLLYLLIAGIIAFALFVTFMMLQPV